MSKNEVLAERLHAARLFSGLSVNELMNAAGIKVLKQTYSAYETGAAKINKKYLPAVVRALNVNEDYLTGGGVKIDPLGLRRSTANAQTEESEIRFIEAQLSICVDELLRLEKASGRVRNINHVSIWGDDAELAANQLRAFWKLGTQPLASVVQMLEKKGVYVISCKMPASLLGVSSFADGFYPVIGLNSDKRLTTVCRTRFTALHELGHLVMNLPEGAPSERRCNQFAACMLMPRETLVEEIGQERDFLTDEEVRDIHLTYGISVAALIHQAYDFRIISREHYDWWFNSKIKPDITEAHWGRFPIKEQPSLSARLKSIAKIKGLTRQE